MSSAPWPLRPPCGSKANAGRISSRGDAFCQPGGGALGAGEDESAPATQAWTHITASKLKDRVCFITGITVPGGGKNDFQIRSLEEESYKGCSLPARKRP